MAKMTPATKAAKAAAEAAKARAEKAEAQLAELNSKLEVANKRASRFETDARQAQQRSVGFAERCDKLKIEVEKLDNDKSDLKIKVMMLRTFITNLAENLDSDPEVLRPLQEAATVIADLNKDYERLL